MNFARTIKLLRTLRGLQLRELGALAGCSQSYLSLIESEQRQPSDELLHEIAKALEVTHLDLCLLASESRERDPSYRPVIAELLVRLWEEDS